MEHKEDGKQHADWLFSGLLQTRPIGHWLFHLDTQELKFSTELDRMLRASFGGKPYSAERFRELIPLDEYERYETHINRIMQNMTAGGFEHGLTGPDGARLKLYTHIDFLMNEAGKPTHIIGTMNDLSEWELAEQTHMRNNQLYKCLFDNNHDATFAVDLTGKILDINSKMLELTGYEANELLQLKFQDFIMPYDQEKAWGVFSGIVSQEIEVFEIDLRLKSGVTLQVAGSALPIVINEQVAGIIGVVKDISEHKQTKAMLQQSREQLYSILNNVDVVLWSHDWILDKQFCSENVLAVYGLPEDAFSENTKLWYEMIHPDDRERASQSQPHLQNGMCAAEEYRIIRPDGQIRWVQNRISPLMDEDGCVVGCEGVIIDITERKWAEQRIYDLAHHDPLTGLPNRRQLELKLQEEIAAAEKLDRKLAIMYLDLDRFKWVNDSLGHHVGDRLLQQVAERLIGSLHEKHFVARQGGDEFTVLLPDISLVDEAVDAAREILKNMEAPFVMDHDELFMTTSIGISIYPFDGLDPFLLMRNSDIALHRAKEKGKNTFELYSTQLNFSTDRSFKLGNDLFRALKHNEFELYYQPRIDLQTHSIIGAEALLRWNHPAYGFVMPNEFIPIAEDNGLILSIGDWVLRTACQQNKSWQHQGLPFIKVSVNLSARQFAQPNLVQSIRELLEEHALDASWLEIEITESSLMQQQEIVSRIIQDLQTDGIRISIDDFGTGYSSLSYLIRFAVDNLKIDRSFIRELTADPDHSAVAGAIINLAHKLRMNVVAEGVETEEQAALLRELNCQEAQGYLYSPPVSAQAFEKLLSRQAGLT